MTGIVISVSKTGYHVNIDGKTEFCLVNNSYKNIEKPIVGDIAELEKREDKYFVTDIRPRKSALARYDESKDRHQFFAANIDVVFIVTSANREFSANRIERFLKLVSGQPIRAVVVLTKTDLKNNFDTHGIECVEINALDKNSVHKLFDYWHKGETALLVGSSGVGKSTVVNSLCGLNLKTREVQGSRRLNQGRHTTSARTMYFLENGRKIIDSPGVRIVGFEETAEAEQAENISIKKHFKEKCRAETFD